MIRGQELSPQLRSRICELKRIGYGPAKIHKIHPDISINTIKTTLRREAERENNASKKRSGRPRKLTEEDRDYIYDLVKHQNPHIIHRDLLAAIDNKINYRSLRYLLKEMGTCKWLQKLRNKDIQAQTHIHYEL